MLTATFCTYYLAKGSVAELQYLSTWPVLDFPKRGKFRGGEELASQVKILILQIYCQRSSILNFQSEHLY
jgi:hypothetical protein